MADAPSFTTFGTYVMTFGTYVSQADLR